MERRFSVGVPMVEMRRPMPQLKLISAGSMPALKHLDHISLLGCSIMIVEDEPLIALDLHAALCAVGAGIIAATDAAEALRLISRNEISAAVIDVKLGERDSFDVCQALFQRRVPFLFYTGHAHAELLKAWPDAPVFTKPARTFEVVACIADLVH
jgi:DNA-binding response OmpR family regulator